ncbi:unnamed protein product [Ostreobium quekettii]|uniref:Uncharacterized protein n=1 Tax=Ostreobium quekettii TaxID=121088 RepID=A0A8S1J1V7_9CHLO|nr:unnamed protein product [Ostreobium quekettii]
MTSAARLATAAILAYLCVQHTAATALGEHRSLLQGTATASSSATQTEAGRSSGRSRADAKVTQAAGDSIAKAVSESITRVATGESNATAEVVVSANAIATGYVKVVVSANVEVSGTGPGSEACGTAISGGDAEATVTAQAVASGLVAAMVGVDQATADGVAEAVKTASLLVSANAFAEACATDGEALSFQKVVAEGYLCLIADALVEVYAMVEGGDATAESFSAAELTDCSEVSVQTESAAEVNGLGEAIAEGEGIAIPPCVEPENTCCSRAKKLLGTCSCGAGCVTLRKDRDMSTDEVVVWGRRNSDFKCTCT